MVIPMFLGQTLPSHSEWRGEIVKKTGHNFTIRWDNPGGGEAETAIPKRDCEHSVSRVTGYGDEPRIEVKSETETENGNQSGHEDYDEDIPLYVLPSPPSASPKHAARAHAPAAAARCRQHALSLPDHSHLYNRYFTLMSP